MCIFCILSSVLPGWFLTESEGENTTNAQPETQSSQTTSDTISVSKTADSSAETQTSLASNPVSTSTNQSIEAQPNQSKGGLALSDQAKGGSGDSNTSEQKHTASSVTTESQSFNSDGEKTQSVSSESEKAGQTSAGVQSQGTETVSLPKEASDSRPAAEKKEGKSKKSTIRGGGKTKKISVASSPTEPMSPVFDENDFTYEEDSIPGKVKGFVYFVVGISSGHMELWIEECFCFLWLLWQLSVFCVLFLHFINFPLTINLFSLIVVKPYLLCRKTNVFLVI